MRIIYSRRAERELHHIVTFYEENVPGLGGEFIEALDHCIHQGLDFPESGAPMAGGYRRLLMGRFPYCIIYRSMNDELRVIAVAHQQRKPDYWMPDAEDEQGRLDEGVSAYLTA